MQLSQEQNLLRIAHQKTQSIIRNMKCKNDGCKNNKANGSSRCQSCTDKWRLEKHDK